MPTSHEKGQQHTAAPRKRDPRLDFFRGLCMFIILVAHTPGNPWTLWIPARFGYSDATEIFVFCSGMASAIAFGKVFDHAGWLLGAVRVIYRVWQVYWAHIGLFLATTAMIAFFNDLDLGYRDYLAQLNLYPFFEQPRSLLTGLLTLTYVPNYFDVLPMYLVILAMMPVVMAVSRLNAGLALLFVVGIYAMTNFDMLDLPAEPWTERSWFFNPFGWQLVFFTGFAFMRGWIPAPPIDWRLVALAALVVLACVPTAYFRLYNMDGLEFLKEWRVFLKPVIRKSEFGLFRYVHFLALAYLAYCAVGEGGRRLMGEGLKGRVIGVFRKVGQQSLAIFVTSMMLARVLGVVLDILGREWYTVAAVNIAGFAILIAVAYGVAWVKSRPGKLAAAGHHLPRKGSGIKAVLPIEPIEPPRTTVASESKSVPAL